MKIEKLEEDKIVVMLTTADLSDMDIDIDALENGTKDITGFLFIIMEKIKEETDFNPYSGQIMMDAVPTADDGVNIVVRRLHSTTLPLTREAFRRVKKIRPRGGICSKTDTGAEPFYITGFDDVCALLKVLNDDIIKAGALYFANGEYCFLFPKNISEYKGSSILCEFSQRRSYHSLQGAHIKEHGKLIAEGDKLLQMALGIRNL